jgi:hypothetical protein
MDPPPGGAGSARPSSRLGFHPGIALLGHQTFGCPRRLCYASACVRPCNAGAETAPLRENRLSRHFRTFHRKANYLGLAPRGGAGSARPQGWHKLDRGMWPVGRRPFAYGSGRNEMPGHPEGRTTRTHRVRPSEKTTLHVIPGFPPLCHPCWGSPPRISARPQGRRWLLRRVP